jgi:hypothetical protein
MGLDMYLRAEKYVGGWEHGPDESKAEFKAVLNAIGAEGIASEYSPSLTVNVMVAYWRKANAIHDWFVNNVQGGEDECKPHHVDRKQLEELRDLCQRLVATHKENPANAKALAEELLMPKEGFFFGSYEIDENYWADIYNTIKQLDRVLALSNDYYFVYQSSW